MMDYFSVLQIETLFWPLGTTSYSPCEMQIGKRTIPLQLSLSQKLRNHLSRVSKGDGEQPMVFDDSKSKMADIPSYTKEANQVCHKPLAHFGQKKI